MAGLYDLTEFKDNCGFGFIAHTKGTASHDLVQRAIEALTHLTHRGGIAADGRTGDGCGLLLQKPDAFLRRVARKECGLELGESYAVGTVMLSPRPELAQLSQKIVEEELDRQGLRVVAWRNIPTNPGCLGPIALASVPLFAHLFVQNAGFSDMDFNARLLMARRKAGLRVVNDPDFAVISLHSATLVYKGLMMPVDLPVFFPDLAHSELHSAICVFHQRFSTNTLPRWQLAQPFRLLAHNGEINTISGNRNWAAARSGKFNTPLLPDIQSILPLVNQSGSDSSSLDNMLEILVIGGMDLHRALRMLVPPAWQNVEHMDADLRAFYEFNSMHTEAWDGPAGLAISDGRYAVCALDRNGLRPSRWVLTRNDILTVSSEVGVHSYDPGDVVAKGQLGPGQLISVDTATGELLHTKDIDAKLKARHPYKSWLKDNTLRIQGNLSDESAPPPWDDAQLLAQMKRHLVTFEECEQLLKPLAESGQEATGSMGDDTPMAVLSQQIRPLTDYFRQQFAQVTNPPIDPLREAVVMSLETTIGPEQQSIFEETDQHASRVVLSSPVLSSKKFSSLLHLDRWGYKVSSFSLNYAPEKISLKDALLKLCADTAEAVRNGSVLIVLSDENIPPDTLPIQALLATGAVHQHLSREGLRCNANLLIATGSVRDSHQLATFISFGATAVYPYLAYAIVRDRCQKNELELPPSQALRNYRQGMRKGLLKIMSKMGISTVAAYRGAQLFEIVGLDQDVVATCFDGTPCRIAGAGFAQLEDDQKALAKEASFLAKPIRRGGILKYMHDQEYHAFNPDVVLTLQEAVNKGDYALWSRYTAQVNGRHPAFLRDLLTIQEKTAPISVNEVEPISSIIRRFDTAAMSLGALSPEAHEALAEAMNSLGGRSNSGEGGEDPARYGTGKMSKIKQVASGRFGVTPAYLVNAEVLQIKMAQGAKPGEGGQLPGRKVTDLIARLRYSVPGVTLISPPPHHDIYSIEDLAQLIFDLKQVNPEALVSVKLVSRPGIGTIAAGVVKAYADLITVSGYDGGTAASPISSIHHAGSPWELGLAEVHQTLQANDLRGKVRLQTDGGLKTGLDVVKAALLGAESFGFGTAPMVALGCKYLRICHLNNCATGIATQRDDLRSDHYKGTVEKVVNFFSFLAQETREIMAKLGIRSMDELIGRVDLFATSPGLTEKQQCLNLSPLIHTDKRLATKPRHCTLARNKPYDRGELAERMVHELLPAIEQQTGGTFNYTLTNADRSIGARISGEIARRYGNLGMSKHPIKLKLTGVAGQSFGAWNAGGLELSLSGDANDYVGKGMAGGKIVLRPPHRSVFASQENSIMGNTCLYGATGGKLFASGRAGERFAVRNSGAHAVVEGAGDHCCEYMTGGLVTVLGHVGSNFGAGMTGGFAYVLDLENTFVDKYNHELVEIQRIHSGYMEEHRNHLQQVIEEFCRETNSDWGWHLLDDYLDYIGKFWLIKPKAADFSGLLNRLHQRGE